MLVNIHEAKTHFSKYIQEALQGKEVIIAKGGVPLIKLTPYTEAAQERHGGQLKGILKVNDDFDAPLPQDILKQFYGEE
ncbi:MAG: type II toxin-antitoxin system prevent-host-death family antitoxin [Legionellales bacterium]|nr:type II toxin-antitoxin system prevent-host-death family antitoxin [Legionellales bacterium]